MSLARPGLRILLACALSLLTAASTASAATTTTVASAAAQKRDCRAGLLDGRGVTSRSWTAPNEGFLSVRLTGPPRSDWDVALFDRASGGKLVASNAFGSNELATTRVAKGQAVTIQLCRRSGRDRRVPMTIDFTAVRLEAPKAPLQLVKVQVPTQWEQARLAGLHLDLADHAAGRSQYAVLRSPEDALKLQRANFRYTVEVPDLAAQDAKDRAREIAFARSGQRAATPGGRTSYRTYDEYLADLKKMVDENPTLVRPVTLPVKTLLGRDITGVEIARDVKRTDDGRPQFVQIGAHHAREWPGSEATIEFGLDLLQRGKAGEPRWKNILDNVRTFVIPIQNVDGFIATMAVGPQPNDNLPATPGTPQQVVGGVGYRRKNCRPLSPVEDNIPCEARQQNDNGVDTNRNYPEQWGGPGTSSMQNDLTYHGEGPASEPEVQAVTRFLKTKQPVVLITNHTFSGLMLRPPGTSDNGPAPDEDRMRQLGDAMARETDYISQYSYQLYDTTGTTDDWLYGGLGAFSFTPEIGKTNFHPSYVDDFIPEYDGTQEKNKDSGQPTGRKLGGLREAYLLAAEAVLAPDTHSIISGTAPAGTRLRIKRAFVTTTSPHPDDDGVQHPVQNLNEERESTLSVGSDGKFTWHVDPSRRPFERSEVPWTLTCEQGGRVLERREIFVERDQQVNVDLACGGVAGSARVTCRDRRGPYSTFIKKRSRLTRSGISLRGRSRDRGCKTSRKSKVKRSGVRRIAVSIGRRVGKKNCRFLKADGTFTDARDCRKTSYIRAKGRRSWRLVKKVDLPRGRYKVWVRGYDKAKNFERKDARHNFLRLRVR